MKHFYPNVSALFYADFTHIHMAQGLTEWSNEDENDVNPIPVKSFTVTRSQLNWRYGTDTQ